MIFYSLGIDHKRAPIDVREKAYWHRGQIADFLHSAAKSRAAVFSTCSRFEIYGCAKDSQEAETLIGLLKIRFSPIFDSGYAILTARNVFKHLARVASGLESQVAGELEIYSQISAWVLSADFPRELSGLVHDALIYAHQSRVGSGLNKPENNIAVLLYDQILRRHRSDDLINIIVAGTGKIAQLFAVYKPQGVRLLFAAHRNILKAGELAGMADGEAVLLKDLPALLTGADVMISATSSPHRVFGRNYFLKVAASRNKELYLYDLALPRDIDPDAGGVNGIILKNIDEVIRDVNFKSRHKAEQISH